MGGGGQWVPLQPLGGGVTMVGLAVLGHGGRPRTPQDREGGAVFLGAANLPGATIGRLGRPIRLGPSRRFKRARASGPARPNWTKMTDGDASVVKDVPANGAAPAT